MLENSSEEESEATNDVNKNGGQSCKKSKNDLDELKEVKCDDGLVNKEAEDLSDEQVVDKSQNMIRFDCVEELKDKKDDYFTIDLNDREYSSSFKPDQNEFLSNFNNLDLSNISNIMNVSNVSNLSNAPNVTSQKPSNADDFLDISANSDEIEIFNKNELDKKHNQTI